jgi:hypothetical protein
MLPIMEYVRIGVLAVAVVGAVIVTHKVDKGTIEHLKAQHLTEQKQALEWGMNKQKEYDNAAIASAEKYAQAEAERADAASERVRSLGSVPPRVLVRGCITTEFVRVLDDAITYGKVRAVPKSPGVADATCAPVDATSVARWLLGIIDAAEHNAGQLTALQQFIRDAQRLR